VPVGHPAPTQWKLNPHPSATKYTEWCIYKENNGITLNKIASSYTENVSAAQWIKWLIVCFSPRRSGLTPMTDIWQTMWHWNMFYLRVLRLSPVSIIPRLLNIHSHIISGCKKGQLNFQFHRNTVSPLHNNTNTVNSSYDSYKSSTYILTEYSYIG
jgi:hypothetical protein